MRLFFGVLMGMLKLCLVMAALMMWFGEEYCLGFYNNIKSRDRSN